MTALEGPDLDTPLVVRRSHLQVLAGLALAVVAVTLLIAFTQGSMRGHVMVLGTIFLTICTITSLIDLLDRRPRIILERKGLHWRSAFKPLVWTAWSDVRSARLQHANRSHGLSWLRLTLASDAGDTRDVTIKLDRTTLDGDEVRDAIRARAPHLFLDADDD